MVILLTLKNTILKYYSCVGMHNSHGKKITKYTSLHTHVFFLINFENGSLSLLEDKQNVTHLIDVNLVSIYSMIFMCFMQHKS